MNYNLLLNILKAEVLPTVGSPDAGAIALAAAYASETLGGRFDSISISVNAKVYTDAAAIPGTKEANLEVAAVLGAIKRQPEKQLSILASITDEELDQGKNALKQKDVTISIDDSKNGLWIEAYLRFGHEECHVIIKDTHTNVVSITKNGQFIFKQDASGETAKERAVFQGDEIRIADMISIVEKMPWYEMEFLLDGVEMNCFAAEIGIAKKMGLGIGAFFHSLIAEGVLSDDIVNYAKMLTVAAADAYLSGESIKIMSCAGSANYGIAAILPVYAAGKKIGVSKEQLARAIAISLGITIYIKVRTDHLPTLYGCPVAAVSGASAAITWLRNGDGRMIANSMKNVFGNLTGMIGHNSTKCGINLSIAAAVAVESSLMAQYHIAVPLHNGMTDSTIEQMIKNLAQ
ncbi:L-serine ammonia-lyase, iron-sulfur-dependent, subunit alpha [Pelosinus propionicus]|uniref:L-cysteine desulfidase n=1 Tax=Pelosinus propionicus DSM 13327 TaxID=1123291 RepID=A0A1I4HXL9_9FIRM|nr:L-serine ammonia-lyase, iron-sulfur-dependent, subunit alpha [Pelosinus propionicus]SFL46915.1 L-cysteine desulfidase [Pelosinus propionicus DSM 13327]